MHILKETEEYILRTIDPCEGRIVSEIEHECFSSDVADDESVMVERAKLAPDYFLVIEDRRNGSIVAYLNGIASNETVFRDEFFDDNSLHISDGKNVMLLGLGVRPRYRGRGYARLLMMTYADRENVRGRDVYLTCHEDKVLMYSRMGYEDLGICDSKLGGESWHCMKREKYNLNK